MPASVAILEDDPARVVAFRSCLAGLLPACAIAIFDRADAMVDWLATHLVDTVLISLDHDLPPPERGQPDPGCGRDVADYLGTCPPTCPVVVHTSNNTAAPGMMWVLGDGGWSPCRVYPSADAAGWVTANWAPVVRRWLDSGLIFA